MERRGKRINNKDLASNGLIDIINRAIMSGRTGINFNSRIDSNKIIKIVFKFLYFAYNFFEGLFAKILAIIYLSLYLLDNSWYILDLD